MKRSDDRVKRCDGFSLVELIVMVVIIGVLAAMAVVRMKIYTDTTEAAVCRQNQIQIETAQTFYFLDRYIKPPYQGEYAESLEDLSPYFGDANLPRCPSGGEYLLLPQGQADCSFPGHQRNNTSP